MWDTLAPGLSLTVTPQWGLKDAKTDPMWPPAFPQECLARGTLGPLDVTKAASA